MITIPVYNEKGDETRQVEIDEQSLGGEVRPALLKQAYVRTHANRRRANHPTKSRGMVEGSTRKLYKQKGTGNARRGDRKANILRGGGHGKAKVSHSWRQDMPQKMRRLANRNALLAKAVDGEIKLVEPSALNHDAPSTKRFASLLEALKINRTCLVALPDVRKPAAHSARNLAGVRVTPVNRLGVFEVLNHRFLLADADAFKDAVERPSAPAADVGPQDVAKEAKAAEATAEGEVA
ncbi:MAG: 50S ribosomal protein L4 [Planctomycetota bacterium]